MYDQNQPFGPLMPDSARNVSGEPRVVQSQHRPLAGHIGEPATALATMNRGTWRRWRMTPDRCRWACRVDVAQSSEPWSFQKG